MPSRFSYSLSSLTTCPSRYSGQCSQYSELSLPYWAWISSISEPSYKQEHSNQNKMDSSKNTYLSRTTVSDYYQRSCDGGVDVIGNRIEIFFSSYVHSRSQLLESLVRYSLLFQWSRYFPELINTVAERSAYFIGKSTSSIFLRSSNTMSPKSDGEYLLTFSSESEISFRKSESLEESTLSMSFR